MRGATLDAASSVVLVWSGSDKDKDISGYGICFGTENPPPVIEIGIPATSQEADVQSGNAYYWQVATTDIAENVTNSEVFVFKID